MSTIHPSLATSRALRARARWVPWVWALGMVGIGCDGATPDDASPTGEDARDVREIDLEDPPVDADHDARDGGLIDARDAARDPVDATGDTGGDEGHAPDNGPGDADTGGDEVHDGDVADVEVSDEEVSDEEVLDDDADEDGWPGDADVPDGGAEDAEEDVGGEPDARVFPPPLTSVVPEPVRGSFGAFGSPVAGPPLEDGSRTIYFGVGLEVSGAGGRELGGVVAVDGRTNELRWRATLRGEIYSSPRLVPRAVGSGAAILAGGRSATFARIDESTGEVDWVAEPTEYATTLNPYNFYTPALAGDVDGDGELDVVQVYGGDATLAPGEPRSTGYLALVRASDGEVLASVPVPDRAEGYMSPLVLPADGERPARVVFGTGGETHGGGLWVAPLGSVLGGTLDDDAVALARGDDKGFIGPPSLADLDGDGVLDLVVTSMDGRTMAFSGEDWAPLWTSAVEGAESFSSPAILRLPDGSIGVMAPYQLGVFPAYSGIRQRLLDGRTGAELWTRTSDAFYATSPVAVDLHGEGWDTVLFTEVSVREDGSASSVIVVVDPSTGETHLSAEFDEALQATALVVDADGDGRLELVLVGSRDSLFGTETGRRPASWVLHRLDLGAPVPDVVRWGGYLGTNHDGRYEPTEPRP